VNDFLNGVFIVKLEEDIEKMHRLDRWLEDKVRPLLMVFKNHERKDHIMINLKNLKQPIAKFQGIGVAYGKEREEIKQLVREAKQDHINGASDDVENYKFLVVGNGSRRRVIKRKITTAQTYSPQAMEETG